MAYVGLERVAHRHGYAMALHGSMGRDLDLIFVPWTDDADDPEKLLKALGRFIKGKSHIQIANYRYSATIKPRGRKAYCLPIGHEGHYLDVSIMPRKKERKRK